ncbi:L-glutamate gamma-semialdehyde dehydrogenase, partial [Nocardia sp. NPDC003354]
MDAIATTPPPVNEPVGSFAPGTPERARLRTALADLSATPTDIRHVIGGRHLTGDGPAVDVVQPHRHAAVLGTLHDATAAEAAAAVEAA